MNSIRQDPVNRNLLFAPTEFGFYISLDDGQNWKQFMAGLPTGRVDEVLVHPREHDLILATHSRSIWIMDDITPLEQPAAQDVTLFKPRDAVLWKPDRKNVTEVRAIWKRTRRREGRRPCAQSGGPDARTVTETATGQSVPCVGDANVGLKAGLNRFQWPLVTDQQIAAAARGGFGGRGGGGTTAQAPTGPTTCASAGATPAGRGGGGGGFGRGGAATLRPGVYRVTLTVNGKETGSQTFSVLEDIWLTEK